MDATTGDYRLTTDPGARDLDAIHRFLADAYWAIGRPTEVIDRSLEGSLVFSLLHEGRQVGMARVVTDRATFAWLCDVYVEPAHRGHGIGAWMIEQVLAHPDVAGLRTWLLGTTYSHSLFARFGFTPLADPSRFMIRHPADAPGP